MQETSKEKGREPIRQQREDASAIGCRMQQNRGFQSIAQQALMKIDYPRFRVRGAQKQCVYKLRLGKAKKEAQEKKDAPEKPGTKNGNSSRNRGLSIQRNF